MGAPAPADDESLRPAIAAHQLQLQQLGTTGAPPSPHANKWPVTDARLPTPWTSEVTPDNALPEYPRPQLVRDPWLNLNGLWQFAAAREGSAPPFGADLAEKVLVPYPIESDLSGIRRHEDHMWYRRTMEIPTSWREGDERVLLHFGAVDYEAIVWVNRKRVARHVGGYGRFSADITDALTGHGPQEILVGVTDRTDATWQPVGKQRNNPGRGIDYHGTSGIWQTVWAEPVAPAHIERLQMTPDIHAEKLSLTVQASGAARGMAVEAVVWTGQEPGVRTISRTLSRSVGVAGEAFDVPVPNARLWSPDCPYLYELQVRLLDGGGELGGEHHGHHEHHGHRGHHGHHGRHGRPVDQVASYFGMRKIAVTKSADGKNRITLNNKPLFLLSTLEQGFWPDGLYTAPTDAALAFDIEKHKELGLNTARKHVKVEPDRWYHHADRLGLLVWQDMPCMTGGRPPARAQEQFERELHEIIDQHKNWTCVVGWVPFNEGWAEWDSDETGRIAREIKERDPERLVNAHSGVNCCDSLGDSGAGDVIDWHQYVGPAKPEPDCKRAAIDGEHGGFGLEVEGHMWYDSGHGYEMAPDCATLTRRYIENQRDLLDTVRKHGISGSVYTQITDVESEVNGFLTYDRKVEKMDFARVREVHEEIIRAGAESSSA